MGVSVCQCVLVFVSVCVCVCVCVCVLVVSVPLKQWSGEGWPAELHFWQQLQPEHGKCVAWGVLRVGGKGGLRVHDPPSRISKVEGQGNK